MLKGILIAGCAAVALSLVACGVYVDNRADRCLAQIVEGVGPIAAVNTLQLVDKLIDIKAHDPVSRMNAYCAVAFKVAK